MADGAATTPLNKMDASLWAAQQGELARQVTELAKLVGTVVARVEDRVTHKELMQTVTEFRKEFSGKIDHMEAKFDQTTDKVDASLDRAVDRIKDSLGGLATDAVTKALNVRKAQENDAMASLMRNDADVERKVRNSQRFGAGGLITGAGSLVYLLGQGQGWWGG